MSRTAPQSEPAADRPVDPEVAVDPDYAFSPVPRTARRGFWSVGFVLLGFTFFSASMSVGAKLGTGLDLSGFLTAVLLGGLFLAVYTGALAYVGARTGLGMDLIARRAFGTTGSYLPSALISLTQMGWFGVGVAMFAIPTSEIIGTSPWIVVLLGGAAMTASAYFGIKAIEIVSFVSVPLIALLGTWSMVTATNDAGGLAQVFGASGGMPLLTGIALVIGSFISGGTATPNFTRFASTPGSAVVTTVVAFLLGNALMFGFGAVGGAFTGKDDIFYVMIAQGLALPAIIVLGANIWTTNNNALYSSGLGFANITNAPRRPLVLVAGFVGTLLAMWLYDNFVGWLTFLSAALPPVGAIFIADFVRHREHYLAADGVARPLHGVHVGAVVGVVAGGLVGILVPAGVPSINAMVVALVCWFVGDLVQGGRPAGATTRAGV
ncbi:cytosine permease [Agilicoccus flavus]|uniref:cytosine permease n=1 Tax=Agilicoccus flavus TaxID=2775968 RepID=UPI001CF60B24|nr:cytosine permease [Agilicoccus flavus]